MEQLNNDQNEFLRALIANPESNAQLHVQDLERLLRQHPQSGVLQALYAYTSEEKNLKRASVYFNPSALYKLINAPSSLTEVAAGRIITQNKVDAHPQPVAIQPKILDSDHEENPGVHDIEDETFEEIVGIEDIDTKTEPASVHAPLVDELTVESSIEADFFKLDEPFGQNQPGEPDAAAEEPAQPQHEVSKYNDDKMPYTFMWWLDKTRREHADTHQPFVKPEAYAAGHVSVKTDELQQQYYENIFHINSLEELEKKGDQQQSAAPGGKRKEDIIIERFIQEEPQIKPQSGDKLDTENKAKKSAEDHDELVTETLAAIYTDQMLYHKAIASYKKLMLKFPEKSRYFAAKIEQLEKRTN